MGINLIFLAELVNYTITDLESIVAIAPYSQYHQMLLALKRNDPQKGSVFQPYLGAYPELEKQISELAEKIFNTTDNEKVAESAAKQEEIPTEINKENQQKKKKVKSKKEEKKVKKKKVKGKEKQSSAEVKKKKTKKKKKVKLRKSKDLDLGPESPLLSDFSRWLLATKKSPQEEEPVKYPKFKNPELKEKEEVVSEPLANLLLSQGHEGKAIVMYQKLAKLFPERKDYFLDKIKQIKK